MTQLLTTVDVQLTQDCCRKFYVVDDGVALMFCNVLTSGGPPVSASNPLPVSDDAPALAYATPLAVAVGLASGPLVAAGAYKKILTIATLPASTNNVWLHPDGSASAVGTGICVKQGGGSVTFGTEVSPMPTGIITAITDAGAPQTVTINGA